MVKRLLITICIISLLIPSGILTAQASTTYGFEATDLSENKINGIWQNIDVKVLSNISLNDIKSSIVTFDISKNGLILLGFESLKSEKKVAIVDDEKNVLKLLEFSTYGSFYLQWKENNILLLLVRGSIIVEISQDGQLVNMISVDMESTTNNSLWHKILAKRKINMGGSTYYIRNKWAILNYMKSAYSQLVKKDSQGNETILYDVDIVQAKRTTLFVMIVIIYFLYLAVSVYRDYKNNAFKNTNCTLANIFKFKE